MARFYLFFVCLKKWWWCGGGWVRVNTLCPGNDFNLGKFQKNRSLITVSLALPGSRKRELMLQLMFFGAAINKEVHFPEKDYSAIKMKGKL